jgi:hypothetical protein
VEPRSFLIMLQESANGGRMDLARVMLSALDDTLKIQVTVGRDACVCGRRGGGGGDGRRGGLGQV